MRTWDDCQARFKNFPQSPGHFQLDTRLQRQEMLLGSNHALLRIEARV